MSTLTADPHRKVRRVPLIVLPGPGCWVLPWHCPASAKSAAWGALAMLDQLIVAAESADRRDLHETLPDTVAALGALSTALAPEGAAVLGDDLPPGKVIHAYFGVRHSEDMPRASVAFHAVLVARWCVAEFEFAALDANDIHAQLLAWRTVIAGVAETVLTTDGPTHPVPAELLEYLPDGSAWDRWIVAHHAYLLFNMLAAASTDAAISCIAAWLTEAATEHLRTAGTLVRGLTAAMLHSAALPGDMYLDEIRPSMTTPQVPKPLTGGAFFEHHHHHSQVERLLRLGDGPYPKLRVCAPELAAARDDLLQADLVDLHAHVHMGYTLVRGKRSLVQQAGEKDSAIAELTRLLHEREVLYAPFLKKTGQI